MKEQMKVNWMSGSSRVVVWTVAYHFVQGIRHFAAICEEIENRELLEMPCLNLSTNVNLEGVDTSSILSEATSTVAKLIGKPEAV